MRPTWPLWAAIAWLTAAGAASARPAQDAQRLGDPAPENFFNPDPTVTTAPDGDSVALVAHGRRLAIRRAAPGRAFGTVRLLPAGDGGAIIARGDDLTALAWTHGDRSRLDDGERCCDRLRAATLGGRMRELSAPGSSVEDVKVVVRGRRAAVAWQDGRGVRASTTSARGARFGPPKTLGRPADQLLGVALGAAGPHAFVLRDANVIDAWRSGGHAHHRSLGRFRPDRWADRVTAAASPTGALLLASTAPENRRLGTRLLVAYRRPGGRLRRHVVRWRRPGTAEMAVTLSSSGDGLVAITQPSRIVVRTVGDGGLGRAWTVRGLATRKTYPSDLALAMNARGVGVLGALVGTAEAAGRERTRTIAWALAPGGRPLGRQVLSFARQTFVPEQGITVTIDAAGRRRVAWAEDFGVFAVRLP